MFLEPSVGKVLIRKKDGLVRTSKFKLGRNETSDSYYEGVGIQIDSDLIGILEPENYSDLIVKLIKTKYSQNDEIALINNYNFDKEKYLKDYNSYQSFRQKCKIAAK